MSIRLSIVRKNESLVLICMALLFLSSSVIAEDFSEFLYLEVEDGNTPVGSSLPAYDELWEEQSSEEIRAKIDKVDKSLAQIAELVRKAEAFTSKHARKAEAMNLALNQHGQHRALCARKSELFESTLQSGGFNKYQAIEQRKAVSRCFANVQDSRVLINKTLKYVRYLEDRARRWEAMAGGRKSEAESLGEQRKVLEHLLGALL